MHSGIWIILCSVIFQSSNTTRVIRYLEKAGYTCKEHGSFKEINRQLNSGPAFEEVHYIRQGDNFLFGFICDDDGFPSLFISDNDVLMWFCSVNLSDRIDDVYAGVLNNLYGAYYLNFKTREVSFIYFNFRLPVNPAIEKVDNDGSDSTNFSACDKKFRYPAFRDTLRIQEMYKEFYSVDLHECMNKSEFTRRFNPPSPLTKILIQLANE